MLCLAGPLHHSSPTIRRVPELNLLDMAKLAPLQLTLSGISKVCIVYHIPIS